MIGGDYEGEAFFQIDPHLHEVVHADVMKAAGRNDPFGIPHPEARDAQDYFVVGFVKIDGKEVAITQRPGKLWVDIEIEVGLVFCCDFIDFVSIEAHEPISLVETVLTDQGRRFEWEANRGVRYGAESRVVDAPELEIYIEFSGAFKKMGVV